MTSDFDRAFAEFAAPVLLEQFGERNEHGDDLPLKYWPPYAVEGGEPLLLVGIAGAVRNIVQFTIDGEVRRETKSWHIERSAMDAVGIEHSQRKARAEDTDGEWQVDVDQCIWGSAFVTLALVRSPRTAGNELRSGTV